VFEGKVRSVIPMNRANKLDDNRLTHNDIVAEYHNGTMDTVARFHQRRSGLITSSNRQQTPRPPWSSAL